MSLDSFFATCDFLQDSIVSLNPFHHELWPTIQKKLRIDWTYHSNAIEGSTLSRGETQFFLEEGLTVEGKPFKDFLDAKNHAEAIDFLFDVVKQNRPITESLIKELNALLMSGLDFTPAIEASGNTVRKPAHPGAYKQQSNHVLQPDGTIHRYVEPLQVQPEMEALCDYIRISPDHVIHVAAMAHYHLVRIHPFDDGNGRVARILMNLILLRAAYSPAVIRIETRRQYLLALSQADQGNTEEFVRFVVEAVRVTQESILSDLKR